MNAPRLKRFVSSLRALGPYLLIELILPGGTLLALLLWLSQGMARSGVGIVHKPIAAASTVEYVVAAQSDSKASPPLAR